MLCGGAILTEFTLLGVAALRLQQRIGWDAPAVAITNADGVERVIHSEYRMRWELA